MKKKLQSASTVKQWKLMNFRDAFRHTHTYDPDNDENK